MSALRRSARSMRPSARSRAAQPESELEPPSSTQSAPRKQSHQKDQGSSKGPSAQVVEPVEMKQTVRYQPTLENPLTKTKKPIPPRSPLPQRINRVIHPGKPAMPRPKRTSAEVAEAEAKKAELLARLEELEKQKKIALAEMELDEEEEDIEEEKTAVRHLKDLQDNNSEVSEVVLDDGLEDFPMNDDLSLDDEPEDEALGTEDSDDSSMPESVKPKPPVSVLVLKPSSITNQEQHTKKKKAARGETREAIETEKTRLRQERNLKRPAEDNLNKM